MTIDRILSIFATIVSVVAVPASGYLSYHFAIKGEKRKEWNAITEPLLESLEELHYYWARENEIQVNHIPHGSVEKIRRRMNAGERRKFDSLWSDFEKSIQSIKLSPAPLMWSADGSHKDPWISPYPEAVKVTSSLLKVLSLR